MSKWALRSKRWTIHSFALLGWATWAIRAWSLIFGEGPEQIAHGHSFLVSKLSNLLTLLFFGDYLSNLLTSLIIKREWVNRSVFFKHTKNIQKNTIVVKFFWANCSFFVINRANERFAHFLIYHERPEQITHGRSFVMSDLSDLLTVAPLSWAIWANHSQSLIWFEQSEQMSELAMSKWANFQPWEKYPPFLHLTAKRQWAILSFHCSANFRQHWKCSAAKILRTSHHMLRADLHTFFIIAG